MSDPNTSKGTDVPQRPTTPEKVNAVLAGSPQEAKIKITAKSTGIYEAVNLPQDQEILDLFGKWADAWGEWTWEQKLTDLDSPSANELEKVEEHAADELRTALKDKGYKDVRFLNGVVIFDDGHVQLTH